MTSPSCLPHGVLTQLDLLKYWKENTAFDLAASEVVNIKPQVDPFVFPVGLSTSVQVSRLKALSRVVTTFPELQVSVDSVIAGSVDVQVLAGGPR